MSHITPNNILDINLIQVLILILKVSTRFYQKSIFLYFLNHRPKFFGILQIYCKIYLLFKKTFLYFIFYILYF